MMQTWLMPAISLTLGYTLGAISPSALIAACKKTNLRERNTGNLGASNTMLTFGAGWGILVLLIDMGKAALASILASLLFPSSSAAGLLAGSASVVGHVFPFYMKFRGGKGLAPFLGMILAFDPLIFVTLLVLSGVLALILNYTAFMPLSLSLLFPAAVLLRSASLLSTVIALLVGGLVIFEHRRNIQKAFRKEDSTVRQYLARIFGSEGRQRHRHQ